MIAAVVLAFCAAAFAIPQISLPFNAQVPDVARVGDEYRFDLSPSTALTSLGGITYSLAQAPSWLQITGNGTLFGTPRTQDVGSVSFIISATDKTGSALMPATLVVANTPSLQIGSDAYNPLSTVGARCGVTCILLPPSTGFSFGFPADSFDGTSGSLIYYATNGDHTPLPAWIKFDPISLVFSGTTPPAASLPESADILFIVAEVPGFAFGQLAFTISVSQHQLVFVPVRDMVNQSIGNTVDILNLLGNLWLDGRPINDEDFAGATTNAPSWLQFDPSSISFSGKPPVAESTQTISIWAQNTYGDVASMVLLLSFVPGQLYKGSIGVLNATAGTYFSYRLSSADFPEQNVSIAVNFGAASAWLQFDRQTLSMTGMIPSTAPPEMIAANLTVTSADGKNEDFQSFEIQIGTSALEEPGLSNVSSRWIKQYCASICQHTCPVPQIGRSNSWFGGGCSVHGTADNMQPSVLQLLGKEASERRKETVHVQAVDIKASCIPWRNDRIQCRQRSRSGQPIQR